MPRRGIELEVKFAPAGDATLADLAARAEFPGWRVAGRHDEDQRNTYFDTADGALEAADCSLRRRVLADGVEWTFKRGRGPGRDGVSRRREVNRLLPRGATRLPDCEPVARARKVAGGAALHPLFTLRTRRRQIELARDDGTRVALALDRVRLKGQPAYEETEIEIELLDGDEHALAQLGLWLMATYGLLPLRGSKRGRAQAWLRGAGLPVVGPALGLRLLRERVAALAPGLHGRPVVVNLAAPRGSPQARLLAEALAREIPGARLVAGPLPHDPPADDGPVIVEGPDALEAGHADVGAWVKAGLPRPLSARLLADARAAGLDEWEILRRCGEYAVPSQRRFLDPAARWADLVVVANHPPDGADGHGTPAIQRKVFGWPSDEALAGAGAVGGATEDERDAYFRHPAARDDDLLRVRLRADTAWVSFAPDGPGGPVAVYEARPRVLDLLAGLGYRAIGEVRKARRRYRLAGWELALDHVAGLGYFCELRHFGGEPDAATLLAALGLTGARTTAATYLALLREAEAAFAPAEPA
ncbi:MAG TPA: CYTH domain-containing protein [Thermomicrobiales bacterium]|nr:CYTH domain-containing protein [Thermomicrobiales bacterium]